jgi:hypothetical protein
MKRPVPFPMHCGLHKDSPLARFTLSEVQIVNSVMNKTFEAISEAIRNPKPPFRKADSQPKKALRHRYERRKIKEYLHLSDWQTEEAV